MSYEGDNKQNDGPFYSDDMSRKVVGKLYDSAEDAPEERSEAANQKEAPINNHFYEESRASRPDDDSIVVGFKDVPEHTVDDEEYSKPSRARQKMDEAYDSDKEERDKYRRQFLNSYTDVRRKGLEGPVGSETRKRPKAGETDNKYDEAVRQESPIRKSAGAAKKTPRDYQVQQTPEKRTSRRNVPGESGEKSPRSTAQKERSSYGYARQSNNYSNIMDLFQLPIVKIAAAVFVVVFLSLIVQSVRLGSANKEIKEYEKETNQVQEDAESVASLKVENDGLKQQVRELKDENYTLTFKVEELQAAIDESKPVETSGTTPTETSGQTTSGGSQSYTVQSGDNLSKISQRFYGSITGVDKIKKANNLTSDNINVGQVLIIPE